jgi:hypothetical protein
MGCGAFGRWRTFRGQGHKASIKWRTSDLDEEEA